MELAIILWDQAIRHAHQPHPLGGPQIWYLKSRYFATRAKMGTMILFMFVSLRKYKQG